jgi:hypothetical protein
MQYFPDIAPTNRARQGSDRVKIPAAGLFKSKIPNPKSQIKNPKSQIPNQKSKIKNQK